MTESLLDESNRNYMFFNIEKSELHKFLFGKPGAELGIEPPYWRDLYIYDLDRGVLAHPCDDRGMDLVGPDIGWIGELFKKHHSWLLEYDLETMISWFDKLPVPPGPVGS